MFLTHTQPPPDHPLIRRRAWCWACSPWTSEPGERSSSWLAFGMLRTSTGLQGAKGGSAGSAPAAPRRLLFTRGPPILCCRVDLEVAKRTGTDRQKWLVQRVEPVRAAACQAVGWIARWGLGLWALAHCHRLLMPHACCAVPAGAVSDASLLPVRPLTPPMHVCSSRTTPTTPCALWWSSTPPATPRCRCSSTGKAGVRAPGVLPICTDAGRSRTASQRRLPPPLSVV